MIPILNKKPDITIVDDHLIFRQGLKSMLISQHVARAIKESSNGIEFIEFLSPLKPDLVLMGISMPHMNGFDTTFMFIDRIPNFEITALSMFSE